MPFRKKISLPFLFSFTLTLLLSIAAHSVNSGVTYQGRILKPDGSPLSGQYVQFKLQVRTPDANNCLLFEETKPTIDMRTANGTFSVTMNDGTGVRTNLLISDNGSSPSTLNTDRVFSNSGSFGFDPSTCTGGNAYMPNQSDGRNLVVLFKDESMSAFEEIPAQKINFVPFAIESKMVAGYTPASLVRVADGTTLGNITPLSNAEYTKLLDLIAGSSTSYQRSGYLGGGAIPLTSSLTSGQVLSWNGTAWTATTPGGAGSVSTTSIVDQAVTASKLSPALGSTGQLLSLNSSGQLVWSNAPNTSQWTTQAPGINYMAGNVGIGTTSPSKLLTVKSAAGDTAMLIEGETTADRGLYLSGIGDNAVLSNRAEFTSGSWYAKDTVASGIVSGAGRTTFFGNSGLTAGSMFSPTERMRISANGNVGVGTTSPSQLLEVAGKIVTSNSVNGGSTGDVNSGPNGFYSWNGPTRYLHLSTNGLYNDVESSGVPLVFNWGGVSNVNFFGQTASSAATLSVGSPTDGVISSEAKVSVFGRTSDSSASALSIRNNSNSSLMLVRNDGNVGIGTTSPLGRLQVITPGEASVTNSASSFANQHFFGDISNTTKNIGTLNLQGSQGGTVNIWSNATSNGGMGGMKWAYAPRSTTNENLAQVAQLTAQITDYTNTSGGELVFSTRLAGNTSANIPERMRITNDGKVGIGTTAPNGNLDVKGSIVMSGATSGYSGFQVPASAGSTIYTLPAAAPASSGQILSSTTGGSMSWVTPAVSAITDLTGEVTALGPGSSVATIAANAVATGKIANSAVTYAKIQNVTNGKILGRSTVGAGVVEELSIGTGLSLASGTLSSTVTDTDSFAAVTAACANTFVPFKSGGAWTCLQATDSNTNTSIVARDSLGSFSVNNGTFNGLTLKNAGSLLNIVNPVGGAWTMTLPATAGAASQVLTTNGSGLLSWTTPATTPWSIAAPGINYMSGNVGIGTTSPSSLFNVASDSMNLMNNDSYGGGAYYVGRGGRGTQASPTQLITDDVIAGFGGRSYTSGGSFTGQLGAVMNIKAGQSQTATNQGAYFSFETTSNGSSTGTRTEKMRIDPSGNVGIGTSSPNSMLHVSSDIRSDLGFVLTAAGALRKFNTNDFGVQLAAGGSFMVGDASAAPKMTVTQTGNVGIGTTSPQATLDINGFAKLKANAIEPAACSPALNGSIAVTTASTICICRGVTNTWVRSNDGTTGCTW